jgi:hypothetical protein
MLAERYGFRQSLHSMLLQDSVEKNFRNRRIIQHKGMFNVYMHLTRNVIARYE